MRVAPIVLVLPKSYFPRCALISSPALCHSLVPDMGVKKETPEEAKAREEKEKRDRFGGGGWSGGFGFQAQKEEVHCCEERSLRRTVLLCLEFRCIDCAFGVAH